MKKIISLILIAILCLGVLTSCAQLGGVVDSIKDKLGMGGEQPAEGPSLDDAASFLHKIYKDKKETTRTDFDVVAVVAIDGVKFPVAWTSDNDKVVIRESTKTGYYTVDLPDVNNEEFSYTLTATISNADGETASKSYTFKVPVIDNSGITSTPVEGVAYKLFLLQGNENRRYYALNNTQNNENKFINTTLNPKDGAEFFVEKVDGGYKVYTEVNGVKNYIYVNVTRTESEDGTVKYSKFIGFSTEEGTVLTYSEKMGGTWTATIHEMVWGIGTYNSFTTISVSEGSYFTPEKVGSSQFVMQFITAEYANTLEEDKLPDSPSDAEGILNQLYGLADGEQAIGSFTLTGKITALDNYNNPTIVVEGFENMPVYCYRLSVENKVGDTITVTATTMKNYGGTYEFMNCTLVSGGNQGGNEGDDGETSENAVLDLMGNANLVSGSGEQNVFAANGITFTNDKASSTSALTVQASYAQRAYAGSTIKIEYPGMTKIVITFDDYSPDGTKNYMSGMDGMVVEGATFSRNNDVLTIIFAAATDVFQSTSLTSQVRIEKIEVFTGEVETPDTPVDPKPETPAYTAPVAGQAYDLYMELPTGKVYFAGSMSGDYLATTTDAAASVKIFFEEVTGGYHIYFMNGDVKTYITAAAYLKSNGYAGCHFSTTTDTPTLAWTYDTTYGIIEIYDEVEGKSDTFFAGTYGTYSTVSLSGAYYKDQIASGTQYPARLELAEGGNQGGNTPVDPQPPVHQHTFVEGKCECGESDPNYVAPETPVEGQWQVTTELKTGDHVLIGNPAYGKLLSAEKVSASSYYNKGVNYSADNFDNVTDAEIWVVTVNDDGSYTFTSLTGDVLALAASYSSLNVTGEHKTWSLTDKGDNLFLLKNIGRGLYLEWYSSKDNWSTYSAGNTTEYYLSFYVKSAGGSDTPVEPPVHEHTFVEGKCECGEEDPNYVPPVVEPDTPVVSGNSADFGSIVLPSTKPTGDSSYTGTYTTEDGWVTTNSAIQCGGTTDMNPQFTVIGSDTSSKAVCMNGKVGAAGTITSPTLNGGISKLTIKYTKMFTDTKLSATVTITDVTTGATYTKQISVELPKDEKYQVYTFEWTLDAPISGDFKIEIVNDCPNQATGNKDRMTVLDIIWE